MNPFILTISIILFVASVVTFYKERYIDFKNISKLTLGIFLFVFCSTVVRLFKGDVLFFGQETFFVFALGCYTLMNGNINKGHRR